MFKFKRMVLSLCVLLGLPLQAMAVGPAGVEHSLVLWLAADKGVGQQGGKVFSWQDQSKAANHAVQHVGSSQPSLIPNAISHKPAIRFAAHSLDIKDHIFVGSDYTIFIVEARRRAGLANMIIGGKGRAPNQNLVLGYETSSLLRYAHFANDLDYHVAPFTTPTADLSVFKFSQQAGKSIYRKHVKVASSAGGKNREILTSNAGSVIGAFPAFGYFYQGDIAEIIAFRRSLNEIEQQKVSDYLIQKYQLNNPVVASNVVKPVRIVAPVDDSLKPNKAGIVGQWLRYHVSQPVSSGNAEKDENGYYDAQGKWVAPLEFQALTRSENLKEVYDFTAQGTFMYQLFKADGSTLLKGEMGRYYLSSQKAGRSMMRTIVLDVALSQAEGSQSSPQSVSYSRTLLTQCWQGKCSLGEQQQDFRKLGTKLMPKGEIEKIEKEAEAQNESEVAPF